MSAFVNVYPVIVQAQDALANHMLGIVALFGLYFAYTLLPTIQYFLDSMFSPSRTDQQVDDKTGEKGNFKASTIEKAIEGSGKANTENSSLRGLVLLNTPGIEINLVRGNFAGSPHGKQDVSSYDDQLKSLKSAEDELSKAKAQNDQLKKELSKTEEEFKRVYGK